MTTLEKIQTLTDKRGLGISKTIIGKYCGCNFNAITYYLNGANPKPEVLEQYEEGLKQLLHDIAEVIDEN